MTLAALSDTCRPCHRGNHEMCTLHDKCGCETCNPVEAPAVVWEDPPTRSGRTPDALPEPQRQALMGHPGRWARLRDYPNKTSAATAAKKWRERCPGFEFVGRRTPTGSALYGRFVGQS